MIADLADELLAPLGSVITPRACTPVGVPAA